MALSFFRTREGIQIEGQRDAPTDNTNRVNIIKARVDPTVTGVDAPMGSLLLRTDTGAVYVKTAATGTPTGWSLMLTSAGASSEDGYQNTYIGKATGSNPTAYTSTNVITSGTDSLVAALGKIDGKIGAVPSAVARTNNPIVNSGTIQSNIDALDAAIGVDITPVVRSNNPVVANTTVNLNIDTLDAAIGANVTSTNYIAVANTVNQNLSALDTTVLSNTNAIAGLTNGISWRTKVFAVSASANLIAATENTALSTLLPLADDQAPTLAIAAFSVGDYILCSNGASSKLWKLDASKNLITTGFNALVSGDTFYVYNDLLDTVSVNENSAIYTYNGTGLVKMADVDWQLATGINLSSAYVAASGTVAVADSIEAALQKIDGTANALVTLSGVAKAAVNLGTFPTGVIITDNGTIKAGMNELDVSTSNIITLTGVAKDALNLGTFPSGNIVADAVTVKAAIASLDTEATNIRTNLGTAIGDVSMGTYTGAFLTAAQTTKQNIQQIGTELEAREIKVSVTATGTGASTTVDTFSVAGLNCIGVEWIVVALNGATGRYMTSILALPNSAGTSVDNNEFGSLETGTAPQVVFSVTITTGTITLTATNNEAGSVTVTGVRHIIRA